MIEYAHILSEFVSTPWAMEESKLRTLESLLLMRAGGGSFSQEEIQARVGQREASRKPRSADGVAVLPIYGVISHRMNMMNDVSGGTSIEKLTSQFRDLMADSSVGTIVLDVDSPGGSVFGVQELGDEIFAARGKKNIIAQVNPMAASAAYWLASQASQINLTPSGSAGSIGVFTTHEDVSKMLEQKGIKVSLISAGKYKTEANQFESLGTDAREFLQQRVDQFYDGFVSAVARGRGATTASVRGGYGQGRMLNAADAIAAGLVDKVSTLDQTIQQALSSPRSSVTISAGALAIGGAVLPVKVLAAAADDACSCDCPECQGEDCAACSHDGCDCEGCTCEAMQGKNSKKPATAENTEEAIMAEVNAAAAAANVEVIRENAIKAENSRVGTVTILARHAGMNDKLAGWLREGKSVDAVSGEINEAFAANAKSVVVPSYGAQVELSDKEHKQFSMLRGIRALCARSGAPGFANEKQCFEFEVSDSIAKKLGKETGGFYMPTNLRMFPGALKSEMAQQQFNAVLTGAAGSQPGSNLVQTSILPSEFIDLLRNMSVCMKMGARKMSDLSGNVQLPKQTGAATLYWTGENPGAPVTPADQAFGNVQMSPKQAMAQTAYSRQFLIQSSLDAEQIIREDHAAIFALGMDLAGLLGTGAANQPKGIAATSGINTVNCGVNGGAMGYALLIACQTALEQSNVPLVRPGIVTNPLMKSRWRQTARLANTLGLPIWGDDSTVAGYPAMASNQLPSNLVKGTNNACSMVIVGDWYQLFFGEWGAMEIIADPYTQAGKGNVVLTPSLLCDVAVRYPQAFTLVNDADPTQIPTS